MSRNNKLPSVKKAKKECDNKNTSVKLSSFKDAPQLLSKFGQTPKKQSKFSTKKRK